MSGRHESEVVHESDASGRLCARCGFVLAPPAAPAHRPAVSVVVVDREPLASWRSGRVPSCGRTYVSDRKSRGGRDAAQQ